MSLDFMGYMNTLGYNQKSWLNSSEFSELNDLSVALTPELPKCWTSTAHSCNSRACGWQCRNLATKRYPTCGIPITDLQTVLVCPIHVWSNLGWFIVCLTKLSPCLCLKKPVMPSPKDLLWPLGTEQNSSGTRTNDMTYDVLWLES